MATEEPHTSCNDTETGGTVEDDLVTTPSPQTGNGQPQLEFFDQYLSSPTTEEEAHLADRLGEGSEKGDSDSFVTLSPPLPRVKGSYSQQCNINLCLTNMLFIMYVYYM